MASRKFIVFDTETTGLVRLDKDKCNTPQSITARGDEVCQIGGLILNEQMMPIKMFNHYCDIIAANSCARALSVHGIDMRNSRLYVTGQFLPEVLQRFVPEFFEENVIFIGYNVLYDMRMVAQTLANSPLPFTWCPLKSSVIPRKGRYYVDVSEFFRVGSNYRKLSSFEKELEVSRAKFIKQFANLSIETNCPELLGDSWERAHDAFYDALETCLLWSDRIWKKKLV